MNGTGSGRSSVTCVPQPAIRVMSFWDLQDGEIVLNDNMMCVLIVWLKHEHDDVTDLGFPPNI